MNQFLAAFLLVATTLMATIPLAEARGSAGGRAGSSAASPSHGRSSGSHDLSRHRSRHAAGRIGHTHSARGFSQGRNTGFETPRSQSSSRTRSFTKSPSRSFSRGGPGQRTLPAGAHAIDGDTFYSNGVRYRIRGIDTPEKGQPKYESAKHRLQQLLNSGAVTVERKAVDKYGRTVAIVRVHGQDVAQILRKEGYAKPDYLAR